MRMKFKKTKDFLPNLRKRLIALEKAGDVQIGYFPENGKHPSGLSYSGLYNILATGNTKNKLPARPVMAIGMIMNPVKKNTHIKMLLKKYLSNIKSTTPSIKAEKVLEKVGGKYVEEFRGIFGSTRLTALSPSTVAYKVRMQVSNPILRLR